MMAPEVAPISDTKGTLPYSALWPVTRLTPSPRTTLRATRKPAGNSSDCATVAASLLHRRRIRAVRSEVSVIRLMGAPPPVRAAR